jgi:hypothetical protein
MSDSNQLPQDTAKTPLLEQSKQRLRAFFQNPYVKKLTPILVPGALAAALLPVFGPVVAGTAAAVAIKNALALLHIEMSTDTIEKLLKPIEGKQLDEDDMQEALTDSLKDLLPTDTKVNEEAAKTLLLVAPDLKEAALSNPRLDAEWLGASLEINLKEQGDMMEKIAPDMHRLILKDGQALEADVQRLLQDWPRIAVEVIATNESKISAVDSRARAAAGQIGHRMVADNKSTLEGIKLDSGIS